MTKFICGLILGLTLTSLCNAVAWRQDDPRELERDADFWMLRPDLPLEQSPIRRFPNGPKNDRAINPC
jgi:hypothetical protein